MISRYVTECALLAATLLAGCHPGAEVIRISGGENIDGHFIDPDTYAAYLQGTLLEASGDGDHAAAFYETALRDDPDAGEIWARLGVVRCTRDRARADAALLRATRLAPKSESTWLALAECDSLRGDAQNAVTHARRAAALAPRDAEASRAVARALDAAGDPVQAERWRRGLELFRPGTFSAEEARTGLGLRTRALAALDHALAEGDAENARAAAVRAHLTRTELAFRALAFGRIEFAREESARVLSVDPGNVDALAAALVASDLARDDDAFVQETARLPETRTNLGPSGLRVMETLLKRRSGDAAAAAWTDAECAGPPGSRACKNPVQ